MKYSAISMIALLLPCAVCAASLNQFSYLHISVANQSYQQLNLVSPAFANELVDTELAQDDSGIGFRLAAGLQYNQYLALELGLTRAATARFSLSSSGTSTQSPELLIGGDMTAMGLDSRVIVSYPFNNQWFSRAQAGLNWQRTTSDQLSSVTPYQLSSTKKNETTTVLAAGIGYGISRTWSMTLDAERSTVLDSDQNSIRLALLVKFD